MLNFIKNFFRCKAKFIKEFTEIVKNEGCGAVLVKLRIHTERSGGGIVVGFMGNFQFTAITPRGRKVICRERFFEPFGGFGDACKATIKLILLGEQKAKELRAKFPRVPVDLTVWPNSQPMDGAAILKLHQSAATCGISIRD